MSERITKRMTNCEFLSLFDGIEVDGISYVDELSNITNIWSPTVKAVEGFEGESVSFNDGDNEFVLYSAESFEEVYFGDEGVYFSDGGLSDFVVMCSNSAEVENRMKAFGYIGGIK